MEHERTAHAAGSPVRSRYLIGVGLCVCVWFSLLPVLRQAGWPYNHENLNWKNRTQVYARHFAQGDLIPIWASSDLWNFGSAMPAYYHKLFYYISGPLYLLTGSIKTAVTIALFLVLWVGTAGVWACCRLFGLGPPLAAGVASLLPFLNYTYTEWLTRGAFAELTAAMLIPWFLRWCLISVMEKTFRYHVILLLWLLFLSHSVIAFYCVLIGGLPLVALLVCGLLGGRRQVWRFCTRAFQAGVLWLGLICPFFFVMNYFRPVYRVSGVIEGPFHPRSQFQPLLKYIYDADWQWGEEFLGFTIELDHALLVAISLGVCFLLIRSVYMRGVAGLWPNWACLASRNGRVFLLCSGSLCLCLGLQTPLALVVYERVPGLAYIQFPWRLLSFIGPLLLLLLALLLQQINKALQTARVSRFPQHSMVWLLLAGALVGTILPSAALQELRYGWFRAEQLESWRIDPRFAVTGAQEYFPLVNGTILPAGDLHAVLRDMRHTRESGCSAQLVQGRARESLTLVYTIECRQAATVRLPKVYSGLERVRLSRDGGESYEPVYAYRTQGDPRVHVDLSEGSSQLKLHITTLWNFFR